MGLLSTEVEVGLSGINIKHFKDLGYDLPLHIGKKGKLCVPRGTTIIAKVSDLTKNSKCRVEANCDCCDKLLSMTYSKYNLRNHDGKTYCRSCALKIFHSGKNNNSWEQNESKKDRVVERNYPEYIDFVRRVLLRDNYTCQCCGHKNTNLEVHHLDGYNWCIEKRVDETNGITLCKDCHSNFHVIYGKGDNTKEQFEKWFGESIELLKYEENLCPTKKIFCIEENKIYNGCRELSELWNCESSSIYAVCNHKPMHYTVKGKHLFWLDEYEKMTDEDVEKYLETSSQRGGRRKVICITTNDVYCSNVEASLITGINRSVIFSNCNKVCNYAGILPDGTKLVWMYYDEYLEKIKNNEELFVPYYSRQKKVVCITTGEIFDTLTKGTERYGIVNTTSITRACTGKNKYAGKLPDGTPLQWMYYDEYKKKIERGEECELLEFDTNTRRVICLTTGKIFNSLTMGANEYNIKCMSGITSVCKGKKKSCGKYNGVPLKWMYYDEYLRNIESSEMVDTDIKNNHHKKVVCITTGEIFNMVKNASNKYNLKSDASIINVCKEKKKSAGKLEDGTPLKWMYYEDFLKLPQEEQNEILSRNKESSSDGSFNMQN